MALKLHKEIKESLGENLQTLIQKQTEEKTLRKIDALTGKDHSWVGKVFKGQINVTVDSLITLILAYKLDINAVFKIKVDYSQFTDEQLWEYLHSLRKRKLNKKPVQATASVAKKSGHHPIKNPKKKR